MEAKIELVRRRKERHNKILGLKLKYFIDQNDLDREHISTNVLKCKTPRSLGYVFEGKRRLRLSELQQLLEVGFRPESIPDELVMGGLDAEIVQSSKEAEYFDDQKSFFSTHGATNYDLWFLNPQHLPMLESDAALDTWVENLRLGANYRTLWILEDEEDDTLRRFLYRVQGIEAKLASSPGTSPGKIHIYPIIWGQGWAADDKPIPQNIAYLIEDYEAACKAPADRTGCKTLHKVVELPNEMPMALDRDRFRRRLDRACPFYCSAAVYVPKHALVRPDLPTVVTLQLRQTSTAMEAKPQDERGFLHLHGDDKDDVIQLMKLFRNLVRSNDRSNNTPASKPS